MPKDERDPLSILKFELEFLEKGGYGRSPRTPWRPQFFFEDSPTCLNYDAKENARPCEDCLLINYVPVQDQKTKIPCRHIVLNTSGETPYALYCYATQAEAEAALKMWLKAEISRLEEKEKAAPLPREGSPGHDTGPQWVSLK